MTVIRDLEQPMRIMIEPDIGVKQAKPSSAWIKDTLKTHRKILTGYYGHWCPEWDYLPIDETCSEWPCPCSMADGIENAVS